MRWFWFVFGGCAALGLAVAGSYAQQPAPSKTTTASAKPTTTRKPDFPPFSKVSEGYKEVVSTTDGKRPLYRVWYRQKDQQLLAELPPGYASQRHYIALTVASGERFAGLQAGERYVYWRRYDKRLALIEPNVEVRATREEEAKLSVKRLFTDRVIAEVPIVALGPSGQPVIDLDSFLVRNTGLFFGESITRPGLVRVVKVKAFPENLEVEIEGPVASGRLKRFHFSISRIPDRTGYKPRVADTRVGYFTTVYDDLSKYEDEVRVRYINRWHLEKGDPKLKKSLPKKPIVFYVEHTTPVRYRRWVREGVMYWNRAFEKVGIIDAIEVYFQDAKTGAHMDKDPEDVRYNFIRWLNNNIGTAIGPSRVHPLTGQILDADIILTDGWIRHFWRQYTRILPKLALEGMGPDELAWFATHPNWDPRIRLAPPGERRRLMLAVSRKLFRPFAGHPLASVRTAVLGDEEYDGLVGVTIQKNGYCSILEGKAIDVALIRMHLAIAEAAADEGKDGKKDDKDKEEKKKETNLLDGIPEEFIGPLIADLVAHEVGHTLGLRHNFKASAIYDLDEINSPKIKGKPFAGSVMDYLPVNIRMKAGEIQGDYAMVSIGPYDEWAIRYGYAPDDKQAKAVLKEVSKPEHMFATDEDTIGPDPLARRYDFSKNPLEYAQEQMRLAQFHREKLLEKWVKDGQSWSKAREGYELTLALQVRALSMMANWLGGKYVRRDHKGDPGNRSPIEPVSAAEQRAALRFVLDNAFRDEAYGLTPKLLRYLVRDKWLDEGMRSFFEPSDFPVMDRVMGIQASVLSMLLNPSTLREVFENEYYSQGEKDPFTLAELMHATTDEIWRELAQPPQKKYTAGSPMISALRRNLQREHVERLLDLAAPAPGGAAQKAIITLALSELRRIHGQVKRALEHKDKLDPYSVAHLTELDVRLQKFFDSQYIYAANPNLGGGAPVLLLFGDEETKQQN